ARPVAAGVLLILPAPVPPFPPVRSLTAPRRTSSACTVHRDALQMRCLARDRNAHAGSLTAPRFDPIEWAGVPADRRDASMSSYLEARADRPMPVSGATTHMR